MITKVDNKKLALVFFRTEQGNEPVREWLKNLTKAAKQSLGEDLKTVQLGWPLGMPLIDSLSHGLWEVRTKLDHHRIARIIFFIEQSTLVLLNGLIKKTQKTPKKEIDLSIRRKRQYQTYDNKRKKRDD